ncbi:Lipid A export ATP-binding/permease protein MsbA [invertebrate metagenome]|uniref:Lipid A export ATP-binding/permease protein MsbA n=1 Tax=invertebrate metagenome TaxID=1711999 RepID=A0A2H9TCJ0_9ZZZZ
MSDQNQGKGLQIYLRLLQYVKPYWFFFVVSLIGYAMFALSQPAVAKLLEYFVEILDGSSNKGMLWVPTAMLSVALFRGIGSFLGSYYLARVSTGVVHDLRCLMYNHMIELPKSYFDNNNSGHLIARITYNVSMVTTAATDAIKVVAREGLTVVFTLGYLFYTNWRLTLIFIALTPVIAFVVASASKRFRKLSRRVQFSMGDLTHVTSESINGYRVVRGFGGEQYEKKRFMATSARNTQQNIKMVKASAVHTPVLQLLVSCALAVLLYMVLWMKGSATTASMIGFITAAFLLPKPIRQLSEVNSNIQKGIAAAESVFEMADQPGEDDHGTIEKENIEGLVEFRHVSFQYPNADHPTLKNISFTIKPGQTVALVGKSGSGKTTVASLLPRFYNTTEGDILIDGVSINDYKLTNLRSLMALVNQGVTLFNDTIANNIAYGTLNGAPEEDIRMAAKSAYAMEFIDEQPEGLQTLVGENGALLSGGQRQRLAIARAILKDAPLLVLDEATSALDTESERYIQAALEDVMKNRSTLVIAHRLSTIENADKIIVMEHGEILEEGTHQSLMEKAGVYARLHRMQFKDEIKDEPVDLTEEDVFS